MWTFSNLLLTALVTSPLDAGQTTPFGLGRGIVIIVIFMIMIVDVVVANATWTTIHDTPLAFWAPSVGTMAPHGGGELGALHVRIRTTREGNGGRRGDGEEGGRDRYPGLFWCWCGRVSA